MVDEPRLRRLLTRVGDRVELLAARAALDRDALAADIDRMAAVKHFFATAIEGVIDVAQHLCASEGWGPPDTNPDAARHLARHGVLDHGHGAELALAIGFRNVLVHDYAEVDDALVLENLDHLEPLQAFVTTVATWTERTRPS